MVATYTIRQPWRRKVEYVFLHSELETTAGWNLDLIQSRCHEMFCRPHRRSNKWEQVDIDALTLSLRSRIFTELYYSLTTFALFTLARGHHSQQHGQRDREGGFPIVQASLLDGAIDLVEALAFDGVGDDRYLDNDAPLLIHN